MLNRLVIAILLLIVTSLASACIEPLPAGMPGETGSNDASAAETVSLRAGWSGEIDTRNPIATWSADTNAVLNLLYDALYQVATDGSITPEIVDAAEISEDGKTWMLTLRDDFIFSDGEPLNAQDVAFSFNLYMNEPDSFLNGATESFAAVEALDDDVIVITLSEAIPNLESLLVGLPILPEHIWREQIDAAMEFANSDPVGSGPFIWAESDEESLIRLISNKAHPLHAPKIDELLLRYIDADDLGAALLAGEVDLIDEVTTEAESELRAATAIEVVSGAQPVIDDIIFNLADEETCPPEDGICSGHPALRDRNVRLAMAHATDKQRIIDENLNGLGTPGLTLIPDSLGAWFNDSIEDYAYDIALANQILDEAGYLDSDGDGVRETPDGTQPLVFRLNWEGEPDEPDTMGDLLSETWSQIGIQLQPEALDFDSLVTVCCPSFDFDLILWGWSSDLDPDFLLSVMTTDAIPTGLSETAYSNPEYDALFAEQAVTLDPEKRRELIWRMQEIVHNDIVYLVPHYAEKVQAFRSDRFQGWVYDGSWLDLLDISSLSVIEAADRD